MITDDLYSYGNQRIVFDLFQTKEGKEFLKLIESYIWHTNIRRDSSDLAKMDALRLQGVKDFYWWLHQMVQMFVSIDNAEQEVANVRNAK